MLRRVNELARYLDSRHETQADFAARVGVTGPIVSMWVTGERRPNVDNAFAIERATGGVVPATAWLKRKRKKAA